MKPNELKAKLGKYAGLLLYPVFTKEYWRQVVHKDLTIQPERIAAIRESINQHIKELQKLEKELRDF